MKYSYRCENCGTVFDLDFKIGNALSYVNCHSCGKKAKRIFTNCNFILKGNDWPSKKEKFNKEMTKRNEEAGERMYKEHDKPEVQAYDYGDGDIRENKK